MYQVVASPQRFLGMRVSFIAFYSPALGRPTFFLDEERWTLSDTQSAIVVSEIDEEFYRSEKQHRFAYVRVSGVVRENEGQGLEPQLSIYDVRIEAIARPEQLPRIRDALQSEARIGFTEAEYHRLIEGITDP